MGWGGPVIYFGLFQIILLNSVVPFGRVTPYEIYSFVSQEYVSGKSKMRDIS